MSEFIEKFTLTPSAGPTPVTQILRIPLGFRIWSLVVIVQNDAASPDPVTLDVEYEIADLGFLSRNPPGAATTQAINKANVTTSEDSVQRIRASLVYGATLPDEDTIVVLNGTR